MTQFRLMMASMALACVGVSTASPAIGCQIPVFRYALERWPSDPYELVIFHRGPLSGGDQSALDSLTSRFEPGGPANLTIVPVDLPTRGSSRI